MLPKILYIVWHLPVYLPVKHFKSMEALLKPFTWGDSRHKLLWHKLKNPTDLRGAVLPDFNLYYVAAQMSHLFHIDKIDKIRSLIFCAPNVHTHPQIPLMLL